MNKKHVYLIDTKLIGYYLHQRGGSISTMLDKISELLINHPKGEIVMAFDIGKSDYRLAISPTYKGQRAAVAAKYSDEQKLANAQFQKDYVNFSKFAKHLPCRVMAVYGVEADDLISLLVYKFQRMTNVNVYMVTADMDYVNSVVGFDNTFIIDVFNQGRLIDNEYVKEKYKLSTRKMFNIWKSIFGDKSDNIKFVKGMAEVKAKKVFDAIYTKYGLDPSTDEIVTEIEAFMLQHQSLTIHQDHLAVNRTSIHSAFTANMKLADTFTTLDNLTKLQQEQFLDNARYEYPKSVTRDEVFNKSFEILGFPILPSDIACKVFKIKD